MDDSDRKLAALILRGLAAGAQTTAAASPDAEVSAAATGVSALAGLVARLVETVGVSRAEEILAGVVSDPAQPITRADLDADAERVKRELGL